MLVPAALVLAACLTWATLTTSTTTAGGAPAATEPSIAYLIILGGMFAVRIAWSVAEVGWGTYQRRERLDLLAASYGLRGLASIVPFAILLPLFYVRFRQNAPLRLADGTAAAVLLCVVGFVVVYYAFDRPRVLDRKLGDLSWDWRSVRSLAWQTLPLGLVALTINLCDSIPRFLIDGQPNGKAQLGYFGSLAYVTLAGNLVIIQAATAAANRLSLYYQRDLRAFLWLAMRLAGLALGVGVVVMAAALLAGEWILRVLYRPDYAQFVIEFQIIVFAHCIALLTNILGAATTQMRLFWVQVPVQIVTLVCTVVAAVLLIPGDTPVRGAAYTALVRAAVQLVLYGACIGLGLGWRRRILTKTEPGR